MSTHCVKCGYNTRTKDREDGLCSSCRGNRKRSLAAEHNRSKRRRLNVEREIEEMLHHMKTDTIETELLGKALHERADTARELEKYERQKKKFLEKALRLEPTPDAVPDDIADVFGLMKT